MLEIPSLQNPTSVATQYVGTHPDVLLVPSAQLLFLFARAHGCPVHRGRPHAGRFAEGFGGGGPEAKQAGLPSNLRDVCRGREQLTDPVRSEGGEGLANKSETALYQGQGRVWCRGLWSVSVLAADVFPLAHWQRCLPRATLRTSVVLDVSLSVEDVAGRHHHSC